MTISPDLIAALATGLVTILGAFFGFTKWMVSKFLHELKPNSGSSMKDQITRLETRVDDIYTILANKE